MYQTKRVFWSGGRPISLLLFYDSLNIELINNVAFSSIFFFLTLYITLLYNVILLVENENKDLKSANVFSFSSKSGAGTFIN